MHTMPRYPMPHRWMVKVEPEPPTLGETLRSLREQRGLLQGREAAQAIGISQNTLSAYERDVNHPSPENLHRIAAFYGVSVATLQAVANRHHLWELEHEPLPGRGIALEATPNLLLLIERVKDAEDHYFPRLTEMVTRALRDLEQGRGSQDGERGGAPMPGAAHFDEDEAPHDEPAVDDEEEDGEAAQGAAG